MSRVLKPTTGNVVDDLGRFRVTTRARDRKAILELLRVTHPGVSSPPLDREGKQPRPRLPRRGAGTRDWDAFWNYLLIDKRTITGESRPYAPTSKALLRGLDEMVSFEEGNVAAAASSGGVAVARDGTRLRVAAFVPRLTFTVPSSRDPRRPVLRTLPTYYTLP